MHPCQPRLSSPGGEVGEGDEGNMRGGMGGMSGEAEGVLRAPWGALGAAQGRLEFFNFLFFFGVLFLPPRMP